MFDKVDVRFITGTVDCNTGKSVWFEKKELGKDFYPTIASCSIPVISKVVKIGDKELLDGGMTSPIPIHKSIEDGNDFHVVISTRNKGYSKSPFKYLKAVKRIYGKKYPNLVTAIANRYKVYNEGVMLCEELEKQGKGIVIRPETPLEVERFNKSAKKLLKLYDEGYENGKKAIVTIKKKLEEMNKNEI